MGYERLIVRVEGDVGWLIFNRPDARNALDARMFAELEQAWLELDADERVRVIVNTGEGEAFQTGVDVKQMSRDRDALRKFSRQTRDAELRFTAWHLGIQKPVIAAVNGLCAGGGLHFVADADVVIVAADAEFVDPHVSVGQVTAYETIMLARKSPMESVVRMALLGNGERLSARRAYQLGICSQVVDPPEDLRDAAQALGTVIARHEPEQLAATKQAMWAALETWGSPAPG